MPFDTRTWTQLTPGWSWTGDQATFDALGGSELTGPRTDPPADRVVSVYGTVTGEEYGSSKGVGAIAITGYNRYDQFIATAISATVNRGVVGVSYRLPPNVVKYSIRLVATASDAGDGVPLGVTFKGVALGKAPTNGAVPGQTVTEDGEVVSRGPARSANTKPGIPQSQHRLIVGDKIDKNWYQYLQSLGDNIPTSAEMEAQAAAAVAAVPATEVIIRSTATTDVQGNQADGYFVGLRALTDSGVGDALVKITRDAYGRVAGTEAATTDALPEGKTNLYHTDARRSEVLVADGMSAPPVMLTNEAEDDFIHQG